MLFGKRFLEALRLQEKKPMMIQKMDNKGGVDMFNSWSLSEHTSAIATRLAYGRELKEQKGVG